MNTERVEAAAGALAGRPYPITDPIFVAQARRALAAADAAVPVVEVGPPLLAAMAKGIAQSMYPDGTTARRALRYAGGAYNQVSRLVDSGVEWYPRRP
jgi:hypothetical protein